MTKKQQSQFQNYIKSGDLLNVKLNINKIDPSYNENYSVGIASALGYFEIVSLLLNDSRVNPSDFRNYAFVEAARNGHINIVKLLLNNPRVDPTDCKSAAIRWACKNNENNMIQFLFKNEKIRDALKIDEIQLYNAIIKKYLSKKISDF